MPGMPSSSQLHHGGEGNEGIPRLEEEEVLHEEQVHPQRDLQPVVNRKSARRKGQQRKTATS